MTPTTSNFAAWLLGAGDPDAIAVRDGERAFSYRELRARVISAATQVRAVSVGRSEGGRTDRAIVPILGENSFELLAAYLGVLYAGCVAAPLAPMSPAALRSVIEQTGARFAFSSRVQHAKLAELVPHIVVAEDVDPGLTSDSPAAPVLVDEAALSLLLYTSGSTGQPRGVMLSTQNLCANARSILQFLPLGDGDRAFVTLPLYYCYGASVVHTHLRVGGSVALSSGTFSPEALCDEVERSDATGLPVVPSLIDILLQRATLARRRLPRLRYVMVSGGRLHDRTVRQIREALPAVALYIRYGVTELTAAASYLPPERLADRLGTIGTGLLDAPLRVEREDGHEVARGSGEVGQIVGVGPHVALGYFGAGRADETDSFRDGKFYTGDLARVDADGFISIVGRAKEFVKTGGHRVSPGEVEEVIAEHPGVLEVVVCGVPHPLRGEALAAGVVVREGHQLEIAQLRRHCMAQLPAFKVPVTFVFTTELPKTSSGKVSRRLLAEVIGANAVPVTREPAHPVQPPIRADARYRVVERASIVRYLAGNAWLVELRSGDAAKALGAASEALDRWISAGLPVHSDGGRELFDPVEVLNFGRFAGRHLGDRIWREASVENARQCVRQLVAPPSPVSGAYAPAHVDVLFRREFNLTGLPQNKRLRLGLPLPCVDPAQTNITVEPIDVAPASVTRTPGHLFLPTVVPGGPTPRATLAARIRFEAYHEVVHFDPHATRTIESPADLAPYLCRDEGMIRVTPAIEDLARSIAGDERRPGLVLQRIWDFLFERMEFGAVHHDVLGTADPLAQLVSVGWSDCYTASALLVGLCRARGIASRMVHGCLLSPLAPANHFWAEAYLYPYGWVPFDTMSLVLADGDRDDVPWAKLFYGHLDYRMKWARWPVQTIGGLGVRFPTEWYLLLSPEERGTVVGIYDVTTREFVYRDYLEVTIG